MATTFTIHAAVLEAMQQFCLKPTTTGHPALSDLLIEAAPESVRLVSTDGYTLAILHLTSISGFGFDLQHCDESSAVIVPIADLQPLLRDRKATVTLTVDGLAITAQASGTSVTISGRPGADYPDYRRVLPETAGTPVGRLGLDLGLLVRFTSFAKLLRIDPHVDIAFTHSLGAVGVRIKGVASFFGVLMPRQVDYDTAMPAWLIPAAQHEEPRIIRLHDVEGEETFTGTDDAGCVWTQCIVDALAEQAPGVCAICGAELQSGWHCVDGGEEVCDSHIEILEAEPCAA